MSDEAHSAIGSHDVSAPDVTNLRDTWLEARWKLPP